MNGNFTDKRPSFYELASHRPARFIADHALRFAGGLAIANLVTQLVVGPWQVKHPGRELVILLVGGILAGLMLRRAVLKAGRMSGGSAV